MTRRVVDLSDYQAGLDVDAVAASVDGVWCKVGDWSWVSRYGWPADDIHNMVVNRFLTLGKPVGSYLFVRPGWTDPATQIDAWRAHCPDGTTVAPMIDLEVNGTLSGGFLRDWVDAALVRVAQVFGMTPVLYWSESFANGYGMSAPSAPHIPMVAEYHRGYSTALWQNVNSWEAWAYSAYGGPGVPPGYGGDVTPRSLIWQWTSSAQIPGFRGLVDCDLVPEAAWQQITDASIPPASDDWETFMATNQEKLDYLYDIASGLSDGAPRWAQQEARVNYLYGAASGVSDGAPRWQQQEARVNYLYSSIAGADLAALPLVRDVDAAVKALSSAGIDVDSLAAKVVADIVAAGGLHAEVDEAGIARALLDAIRGVWATGGTTGGTVATTPAEVAVELPDPNPERRAAVALADLATSVFDSDTGVSAVVSRQLAKMRPAPGHEVTNDDIAGAVEGALADAATRAGVKAASLPPLPPVPSPVGDMGGEPTP